MSDSYKMLVRAMAHALMDHYAVIPDEMQCIRLLIGKGYPATDVNSCVSSARDLATQLKAARRLIWGKQGRPTDVI